MELHIRERFRDRRENEGHVTSCVRSKTPSFRGRQAGPAGPQGGQRPHG